MTRAASEDRRPVGVVPAAEPPEAPERRPAAILFLSRRPSPPLERGDAFWAAFAARIRRGVAHAMMPGGYRCPAPSLAGHAPHHDHRPFPTAGSPLRRGGGAD